MTLPEGRIIRIEFEARLPAAATKEQIDQWVAFELGSGSMPRDNPLGQHDLEYWQSKPALTDSGMNGRIEDFGHRHSASGGATFQRRYIRETT